MNKIYSLTLSALVAFCGSALGATHRGGEPAEYLTFNGHTFRVGNPAMKASGSADRHRDVRRVVGPDVITEMDIPASAVARQYSKTSGGYYFYGNYQAYQDAAQAATIYWDGDDAYIYNILSYKETFTYVQATRSGNTLILPLNQFVEKEQDFGVKLGLLKTVMTVGEDPNWDEEDSEDSKMITYIDFVYSEDYDEVSYSIADDGSLTLVIPPLKGGYNPPDDGYEHPNPEEYGMPPYCLGFYYTDDFGWTGDGDIFQTYYEFNYKPVVEPAGLTYGFYSYRNSEGDGVLVYIGRDGDTLYLKGLSTYAPDALFLANISADGKTATVPQDQFIGKSMDGYYNLLTKTAVRDRFGNIDLAAPGVDAILNLSYDEEGNISTISFNGTSNVLIFNYADDFYDPYDEFPGIVLKYQPTLAGVPMPPGNPYFEDHTNWLGAYWLFFYLDPFTAEDNILDINELYYRIYVNGKPYEFEEHAGTNAKGELITMYPGIAEPTSLISYSFYNGSDIFYDEYRLYYVAFYDIEGFETIGVQTVYTYGDEEVCSPIITIDVSGVESAVVDENVPVRYYDLQGTPVANPAHGLFIKVAGGKASKVIL